MTNGLSAFQFSKVCNELTSPQLAVGLFAGYLAADLVTGIIHAAADEDIFPERFKRFLVENKFREEVNEAVHHIHPTHMLKMSYWYNNRPSYLVAYLFFGAAAYVGDPIASCVLLSVAVLGANAEFFHAASHGGYRKNPIISKLQDWRVILGKRHHAKHHNGKFDRNFCLISGWMDYLLNPTIHYALRPMGSVTKRAFNGGVNFFRSWCGNRNKECVQ
ncbi:MAG: fatty acid desaturase CarF family protein [Alphaproteobacteria bacterium]